MVNKILMCDHSPPLPLDMLLTCQHQKQARRREIRLPSPLAVTWRKTATGDACDCIEDAGPMIRFKSIPVVAAIGIILFCSNPGRAAPITCSSEHEACVSACAKSTRLTASACVTECHRRKVSCSQTGCWDNGVRRYCDLLRR